MTQAMRLRMATEHKEHSMGYCASTTLPGGMIYSKDQEPRTKARPERYGNFITVRDGDGDINYEFYYARARKLRSETAWSLFAKMFRRVR